MFEIREKVVYNPAVKRFTIHAPLVARHAQPGQFLILRVHEQGERIPLTIADFNRDAGTVTIVVQEVGKTSAQLGALEKGDRLTDVVGPLGVPSHLDGIQSACVVGGGLGCAIAYPQAKALFQKGAQVDIIAGFREASLAFFLDEMRDVSQHLSICTDDGSLGRKGLVTDELRALLDAGRTYDLVIAIGPLVMMKYVCLLTKEYNIPTVVSMNPIMIDGTGMCGCCRLTVGGTVKFACVDGPDFPGHDVDFDEMIRRNNVYRPQEQEQMQAHVCRLGGALHGE